MTQPQPTAEQLADQYVNSMSQTDFNLEWVEPNNSRGRHMTPADLETLQRIQRKNETAAYRQSGGSIFNKIID